MIYDETKQKEIIEEKNLITEGIAIYNMKCFHIQSNCQLTSPKSRYYNTEAWGTLALPVQKYPHTQQHIIHKAPRLYITKIYIDRTWSVQCIIQLLFRNWGFPELG